MKLDESFVGVLEVEGGVRCLSVVKNVKIGQLLLLLSLPGNTWYLTTKTTTTRVGALFSSTMYVMLFIAELIPAVIVMVYCDSSPFQCKTINRLFIWMDDLFNVKGVQWRCGDSVCLHGFWYMTCLYSWSAYWGERFPSSTRLRQEPHFTWVIKNTEFVVYCKHTQTQREDGKMVSIGVTQRRCLTSGCWLNMVNFPRSSFDEEMPQVSQQWNFTPTYSHTYQALWISWSWCWRGRSGWPSGSSFHRSLVWRRSIPSDLHGQRLWGRSWGKAACSF